MVKALLPRTWDIYYPSLASQNASYWTETQDSLDTLQKLCARQQASNRTWVQPFTLVLMGKVKEWTSGSKYTSETSLMDDKTIGVNFYPCRVHPQLLETWENSTYPTWTSNWDKSPCQPQNIRRLLTVNRPSPQGTHQSKRESTISPPKSN